MPAPDDIVTKRTFDRVVVYRRACAGAALDELLADPDAVFAGVPPEQTLKHDRTTTLIKLGDDDKYWIGKRYNTKGPWHAIRRCFKSTRARNCWDMSQRLLAAGIRVAQPVAMLEQRFGPLRRRSFYFCEYVAGSPLEKVLDHNAPRIVIQQMCEKFADLFSRLSAHRIAHGDMKATNLLLADDELVLLDLDAVAIYSTSGYARAYRKDRDRFLRNWDQLPALQRRFAECIPEQPANTG